MRVDASSTISIAGLSLILVLSSAGSGSAAPELIVNESAFACHHHGKQLMLSCPMPRQAYHKEGVGAGRFFCDQSFLPPSAEISTRSEEHTSELQSLMRISYAVFCLKKKKKRNKINKNQTHIKKTRRKTTAQISR